MKVRSSGGKNQLSGFYQQHPEKRYYCFLGEKKNSLERMEMVKLFKAARRRNLQKYGVVYISGSTARLYRRTGMTPSGCLFTHLKNGKE